MIKEFTTTCSYPTNRKVTINDCRECRFRQDNTHYYLKEIVGCVYCGYGEENNVSN